MSHKLERSKMIVIGKEYESTISENNKKLLEKYIRDMEIRELSKKTIYNYERDLIQWFSYLTKNQFNLDVEKCTEDDIEEFIYFCKKQGNNTERIKRRLSSISAFYKYLRRKKIVKDNPLEFIIRPKKGLPVVEQTFLTKEQYELLKEKLKEENDLQLELYCMISLDTMARVNAISNIKWEQVDFNTRTIDDVLEKEGYLVTLYFDDYTKDLLLKLKTKREENNIDDSGFVFISNKGNTKITVSGLHLWTKKAGNLIGVKTLHPHDFRHSGSQLRKLAGMPIEDISELLNHKGLDVTKNHYLRQDKKKMQEKKDKYKI